MIGITLLMLLDDVFALLFKFSSFTFDSKSCRGQNFRFFWNFDSENLGKHCSTTKGNRCSE